MVDLFVILAFAALVVECRWALTRFHHFRWAWQRSVVAPCPRGLDPLRVSRRLLAGTGASVVVGTSAGIGAYRPSDRVIVLAPALVDAPGLGSLAVVVHEVGHAIQHRAGSPHLAINRVVRSVAPFVLGLGLYLGAAGCLDGSWVQLARGEAVVQIAILMGGVVGACERNASARGLDRLVQEFPVDPGTARDLRFLFESAAASYLSLPLSAFPMLIRVVGEAVAAEPDESTFHGRLSLDRETAPARAERR